MNKKLLCKEDDDITCADCPNYWICPFNQCLEGEEDFQNVTNK